MPPVLPKGDHPHPPLFFGHHAAKPRCPKDGRKAGLPREKSIRGVSRSRRQARNQPAAPRLSESRTVRDRSFNWAFERRTGKKTGRPCPVFATVTATPDPCNSRERGTQVCWGEFPFSRTRASLFQARARQANYLRQARKIMSVLLTDFARSLPGVSRSATCGFFFLRAPPRPRAAAAHQHGLATSPPESPSFAPPHARRRSAAANGPRASPPRTLPPPEVKKAINRGRAKPPSPRPLP